MIVGILICVNHLCNATEHEVDRPKQTLILAFQLACQLIPELCYTLFARKQEGPSTLSDFGCGLLLGQLD